MLPSMDRHVDNTFKKFSVTLSTGTSKVDKLLKMPSDSISEGVIFQNFMGGMPLDSPSAGMLRMPVCFANYECKYLTSPTSAMMTGLVVPPPLFKSLDLPLKYTLEYHMFLNVL